VSPALHLKPGTIFAGDFRIVSPLNTGGMGVVYVADQISTGCQRALKIMLPELLNDQELRDRFLREARVCARIPSDHVVQVVAAGIDQGTATPWLAMELLHGEDLSEYIERRGGVTPSGLIEIFRQLCHALGAAHSVGVVHRDLKPENIFLSVSKRAGAPFTVKVLDFGIAKMIADASAKMTALIGSPLWMAPEQMDPRMQISPATDVWPLCLLAFWLLTGQHYWRSARIKPLSMHAIMREVLFEPVAPASERAAELGVGDRIPLGFDQWFARCATRDTGARIQNALAALAELEHFLGNGPRGTMPHPPSLAEIEAVQREHEQELENRIEPQDATEDMLAATREAEAEAAAESEAFPPTLQSQESAHDESSQGMAEASPEPRPPVISLASPVSSGTPTSTNGLASDDFVRRSSAPASMPSKSSAPLWLLTGGLVVLLVVLIVFVKQRADVQQTPSGAPRPAAPPTATVAPAPSPTVAATSAPPPPATAPTVAPTATASAPAAPTDVPSFTAGDDGTAGKSFNTAEATVALRKGALAAKDCKRSYGPTGQGTVKVTFSPTGSVASALLLAPQYAGTLVGTCVANQFLKLRVPPFEGTAVTTNMPFEIPP
jgi:serine/threonine-protein kinase